MENIHTKNPLTPCACPCHKKQLHVLCCGCYLLGKNDCECGEKKRCCGDPKTPRRPEGPAAPGWRPGDRPLPDPLAGATDENDLHHKFQAAVIDLISGGGHGQEPKFGPRKDEYLPYLVIRAYAGDRGARPTTGAFWESPDVFVAPDLDANSAPALPTTTGNIAHAGAPNTLWAHVWNLGNAPVFNARVEFYWCNPSLGLDESNTHLIGVAYVDLDHKSSGRAHAVVKCPTTWVPTFVNGGHECLIVRCFEPLTDSVPLDQMSAWDDRHVAQRNLAVINASSPAELQLPLTLGCATAQGPATVEVIPVQVADLRWLSVLTGRVDSGLKDAKTARQIVGLTHPTLLRPPEQRQEMRGLSRDAANMVLQGRIEFQRGCDEQETVFYMRVDGLKAHECCIYRIVQKAGGRIVGGYTVIARKE